MRRLTRFWTAHTLHQSTPHRRSREELAVIADRFITDTRERGRHRVRPSRDPGRATRLAA